MELGLGGSEILLIAIVALIVVGPKDLPVLMRKAGDFMTRVRAMAADFRASFDEMARQSELDELRKEVEALRAGRLTGPLVHDVEPMMDDIRRGLEDRPRAEPPFMAPAAEVPSPDAADLDPDPAKPARPARKPRARKKPRAD